MPIVNDNSKYQTEKSKLNNKYKEKAIQDASFNGILKMIELMSSEIETLKATIETLQGGI